jgi:glycerol-3-phosphate cytidylyltransferase-like family protein
MLISQLFEATGIQKTLVIIPGGFHPFHAGHLALYRAAERAFPNADVYVAATDDTSERPLSFAVKEKLARLAGVPKGHFVQVKSPFRCQEIVDRYDPNTTALIFVRSTKDKDKPPQAGTIKKDGSPSYLQVYDKNPLPLSKHGYMTYLPTVEFSVGNSGITSASEIRSMWPKANAEAKAKIVKDLYPMASNDPKLIKQVIQLLDGSLSEDAAGVGVVASNKKMAKDPRYSTSMTVDVHPDTPYKNAHALGLM